MWLETHVLKSTRAGCLLWRHRWHELTAAGVPGSAHTSDTCPRGQILQAPCRHLLCHPQILPCSQHSSLPSLGSFFRAHVTLNIWKTKSLKFSLASGTVFVEPDQIQRRWGGLWTCICIAQNEGTQSTKPTHPILAEAACIGSRAEGPKRTTFERFEPKFPSVHVSRACQRHLFQLIF